MKKNRSASAPWYPFVLWIISPVAIYITVIMLGNVFLTFLVFYLGIGLALPVFDLTFIQKTPRSAIATAFGIPRKPALKTILTACGIGLFFGVSIYVVFQILSGLIMDENKITTVLQTWHLDKSNLVPLFVIFVFVNPCFEELFWRGYMTGRLTSILGKKSAIVISSLGYASYHLIITGILFSWIVGTLLSLIVFGAGVFWAIWRMKTGSIIPTIISHALADLGIMIVYITVVLPMAM